LAKGAFLVSSEQRNGAVAFVNISSEVGGPLKIASPWGDQAVRVAGRSEELKPESGLIVLETTRGGHYDLTPEASKP
jgi:alpha-L-fucosidase 2